MQDVYAMRHLLNHVKNHALQDIIAYLGQVECRHPSYVHRDIIVLKRLRFLLYVLLVYSVRPAHPLFKLSFFNALNIYNPYGPFLIRNGPIWYSKVSEP
ncbi:hypothetical protein EBR66_08065 [bacterium]|nr:hypothetical protein [bacterium]